MIAEIRASGRLHAGLFDLSETGYRLNGGIGWSIDGFELIVRARASDRFRIVDRRAWPLTDGERESLQQLLAGFCAANDLARCAVEIEGCLPSHRGLGAGTALRLAALEACAALSGLELSRDAIVAASGRGGTSGIGIRTYFEGGLVADIGHPREAPAAPSRDRSTAGAAMPLARVAMPDWAFGIALPRKAGQVTIETERAVFSSALPLAMSDVQDTLYHSIYGILGGALAADAVAFSRAVDAIQLGKWKQAEWRCHGAGLLHAEHRLREAGATCIGLSSMGPALYFLPGEQSNFAELADEIEISTVVAKNTGRELRLIPDA